MTLCRALRQFRLICEVDVILIGEMVRAPQLNVGVQWCLDLGCRMNMHICSYFLGKIEVLKKLSKEIAINYYQQSWNSLKDVLIEFFPFHFIGLYNPCIGTQVVLFQPLMMDLHVLIFNEVQIVYILTFLWSNSTTSFVMWKNVQLNDSPKCSNLLWDAPKITIAQVFQFLKFCHKCYVDFFGKLKPMLTNNSSPICNLCNSN